MVNKLGKFLHLVVDVQNWLVTFKTPFKNTGHTWHGLTVTAVYALGSLSRLGCFWTSGSSRGGGGGGGGQILTLSPSYLPLTPKVIKLEFYDDLQLVAILDLPCFFFSGFLQNFQQVYWNDLYI